VQSATYLLEIGTEELPVSFLQTARVELKDRFAEAFAKQRLAFETIDIMATPRRLVVRVANLATQQQTADELLKGPPATVAFDASGNPTPAALGFAKRVGVDVTQLARETVDGTEYVVYHRKLAGEPVQSVLPQIVPDVVLGLSGSHFMAWDTSEIRFSRPIRWVVSLLDDAVVPVTIGLTQAGRISRGHRFQADAMSVSVQSVRTYATQLWEEGHVAVDIEQRKAKIWAMLEEKAASLGGHVPQNPDLLETVTFLVESPQVIAGQFDEAYLKLPKEVIMTVMEAHQKYFPVVKADGSLHPAFMTISNNTYPQAASTIASGNERVLKARLDDATFFFEEDTKHPLSHYLENLKGITFQKGLGSLYEKSMRMQALAKTLAPVLGLSDSQSQEAQKAASLAKADLATGMVRELTELQGVIGRHYAKLSGETDAVSEAIEAHYLPKFSGDAVAKSPVSLTVSLVDKLDTLVAVFAQKGARIPTGSKDPMGLRRLALGLIQTILENKLTLNLSEALVLAYDNLGALAGVPKSEALEQVERFLLQRFNGYLLDQGYAYDTIDAVLSTDASPWANLQDTLTRLSLLKDFQQNRTQFTPVYEAANRTARILGDAYQVAVTPAVISPALFDSPAEEALYQTLTVTSPAPSALTPQLVAAYVAWTPAVEGFFESVLVNSPDASVKANRYALLSLLNQGFRQLADLTQLVV